MNDIMGIATDERRSLNPPSAGHGLPSIGDATRSLQPEKRLLLAILEAAVNDFQKYATASNGRGRRLFVEASAWFDSSATEHPVDFENICHALGLDASFIRGGLRRWCIARRRQCAESSTEVRFPVHASRTRRPHWPLDTAASTRAEVA
jgi:hypothetical protein